MNSNNNKPWNTADPEMIEKWQKRHRRGRIIGGFFIVGAGLLFLAREMGAILPEWLFTWQMLLIAIGVFSGLKNSFQNVAWIVLITLGTVFLLRDYYPYLQVTHYLWPIAIIVIGLLFIFRPSRRSWGGGGRHWREYKRPGYSPESPENPESGGDYLDINSVFGSVKKNVVSKQFRGGEINAVFGGAEINLSQADFTGTVELEINSVFGGTRIVVPPNWEVKSELNAVMGGVEDKRPIRADGSIDHSKVLMLRGSAVFGGIELTSY